MQCLETVAIVGVGLIGGSIGLALGSGGLAARVVGVGRDPRTLQQARDRGIIDHAETELEAGVAQAEVVVVCTPVSRIALDVCRAAQAVRPGALVTDAGSTKRQIVESVESLPAAADVFVGAHPVAGSERSGAAHARAGLLHDRVCVLTPTRGPHRRAPRPRLLGIAWMPPARDEPHRARRGPGIHEPSAPRLAAALASTVPAEWLALAAGAYRDGTRVAAADASLWTAIFRDNRGPLLKALVPWKIVSLHSSTP